MTTGSFVRVTMFSHDFPRHRHKRASALRVEVGRRFGLLGRYLGFVVIIARLLLNLGCVTQIVARIFDMVGCAHEFSLGSGLFGIPMRMWSHP